MVVRGNMQTGNTQHHPRGALSSSLVRLEIIAHPSGSVVGTYLEKKTTSHLNRSGDNQSYQPFDTFTFHPSPLLSLRVIRRMLMLLLPLLMLLMLLLLLLCRYLGHRISHLR